MFGIRRADQREIGLVGDGEDDPAVLTLEEIALVVIEEAPCDDVAAADQPHVVGRIASHLVAQDRAHPGSTGIHQHPGAGGALGAGFGILQHDLPEPVAPFGGPDAGPHVDPRAPGLGIAGIEHHKAGILHPAIRIFVGLAKPLLQRRAGGIRREIDRCGAGQDLAAAEIVIEQETEPDQPGRAPPLHPGQRETEQSRGRRVALVAHVRMPWQHEAHRPTDMRHRAQQGLALDECLAHEADLEVFEVAKAAVEELGGGRRRRRGEVVHFGEMDRETTPGGVPGDTAAIDAASDHEDIDHVVGGWSVRSQAAPPPLHCV